MAAISNGIGSQSREMTGDTRTDIRTVVEHIATTLGEGAMGRVIPGLAADLSDNPGNSAELAALLGPQRAANSAVILAAAGRGDLPHDVDARLVLDMIAGAILYRSLMQQPVDSVVVEQLANAITDGHLPRTPTHPAR